MLTVKISVEKFLKSVMSHLIETYVVFSQVTFNKIESSSSDLYKTKVIKVNPRVRKDVLRESTSVNKTLTTIKKTSRKQSSQKFAMMNEQKLI